MLNSLYKKLHIVFISSIMLIISIITGILCANSIKNKLFNDSVFFSRLSMFIIYELENPDKNPQTIFKPYENNYSVFALLTDTQGNEIYQSELAFPTNRDTVLNLFQKQVNLTSTVTLERNNAVTSQGGTLSFRGNSHDKYFGILSIIVDKHGNIQQLVLLQQQQSVFTLIKQQLPFYITIWFLSLFCTILVSHFLLKHAIKPTEKMLKSQKNFIASASHELKAPLAVILANNDKINDTVNVCVDCLNCSAANTSVDCSNNTASVCMNYPSDSVNTLAGCPDRLSGGLFDIQKAVNIIDVETMRMSELIKKLLFLASSDAGTGKSTKSPVNLDTLLITLYETYEAVCSKNGISLEADFMDSCFPELYTDKDCLFQILSIYMDNAIAHSKTSSEIRIKAVLSNKNITLSIIDNGQGISEKDKPYIFDRFYCADKSHTDKAHFGLGLSIVKELAKLLPAEVGLSDSEGGGATFFVVLPLK
ncbi:MAG: HAMP domain-containing histidine kinase [Lachnospiraceae bacterium]|nr:HAMP domain-containing histidine kinase [Lachnospiraceae bacterium]